jgi:hypothetical protein
MYQYGSSLCAQNMTALTNTAGDGADISKGYE